MRPLSDHVRRFPVRQQAGRLLLRSVAPFLLRNSVHGRAAVDVVVVVILPPFSLLFPELEGEFCVATFSPSIDAAAPPQFVTPPTLC